MSYDLHNRNRVKTKKDHKCEGCFEVIPKGTETTHCKGRYQGNWYNYHMCELCIDYMDDKEGWDDGFTPGEIGDLRNEEVGA